ncbi:nucleotide sugar dehydrogenase [Tissierella praeacuta]|uniref:UDP-N-acetyl-D-mannosaminuronic acid dehydrogenase n=1 Tax=Tissierella praeacuta DSM 18095 TaxID=1123404 RepID=A0A1M4V845_9FIRM|nr:nucleotide sugar dehydrogenase [Tissierella praeacuta]TCU74128.1 UDP-N-acetyl-D-mannosaminuronic acid dehydrogenase [Tissierella praeacuta]SHE65124.1 UDP-N-acetyl-D-mannosaminuronic acid dehydrogenase [Tissierella praeacuta DSM 18095]SUP03013.1 UDP-glucose 6-dehydrogenase tuaD [Tissierella praeacuta]
MELMNAKKITIIGLGYIGLPTAAIFAKSGMEVLGYDINERVINALNQGKIIIEEPGLEDLVKEVVDKGSLKGITKLEKSDAFIISVPTPINKDKTANMDYVKKAVESIVPILSKGNIVVLESTSPPESTEKIIVPILKKSGLNIGEEVFVAHSPERVLPGKIIQELIESDRIIGGINEKSAKLVKELYSVFVKGQIFTTDSKTAEMCKLMENTYRDVNIALANELAITCEEMGINAWDVIELANRHPRVNLHQPGPGVGGHCLAVDPWFIVERQSKGNIIRLARETNDGMPKHILNKLKEIFPDENAKIAILGLTYKPNIDDMRESPIVNLVSLLRENTRFTLSLHDPHACKDSLEIGNLMVDSLYDAVKDSDLMILAVNHNEYKDIDFEKVSTLMKDKHIYDTRNFLDEGFLKGLGFKITLLGRD